MRKEGIVFLKNNYFCEIIKKITASINFLLI